MKATRFLPALAVLFSIFTLSSCSDSGFSLQYYSPLENAEYVSTGATIIVRYGPVLSDQQLADFKPTVEGSESGRHEGRTILADDHRTLIFEPDRPFAPGEQVTIDVGSLRVDRQNRFQALSYSFTVAANQQPGTVASPTASLPNSVPRSAFPNFMTLPQDIPHYTVSTAVPEAGEGYVFVAPFYWTKTTVGSYLLILDGRGQIVYYQSMADELAAFDFKVQPNGLMSYWDQKDSTFYLMDSHYQVVDTYQAGNGYVADLHDFQILPDGNALLMAYDDETVDMSKIVQGGKKDATVTGLVIQEIDPSKNVIFEWRSWDHVSFFDSTATLTEQEIDLVHGNALALANDGNLLLSSRNLCEITKIDLQTGEVIWRLGGKANMFEFADGAQSFAYQHDVRQLPNGHITIFDNQGTMQNPAPSRALEYEVDETDMTVTEAWSYTHTPPVFGVYMGNVERLGDGNSFVSWGSPYTGDGYAYISMTEVTPDKRTVFELSFDEPYVSYRAFRFPWHGSPDGHPALAFRAVGSAVTLGYSWNGATEVATWRVFGGNSPQALGLIEEKAKIDFETQSHLSNQAPGECYFQVAAVDKDGNEMARSNVISTDPASCPVGP
jgi:hypothetical protein